MAYAVGEGSRLEVIEFGKSNNDAPLQLAQNVPDWYKQKEIEEEQARYDFENEYDLEGLIQSVMEDWNLDRSPIVPGSDNDVLLKWGVTKRKISEQQRQDVLRQSRANADARKAEQLRYAKENLQELRDTFRPSTLETFSSVIWGEEHPWECNKYEDDKDSQITYHALARRISDVQEMSNEFDLASNEEFDGYREKLRRVHANNAINHVRDGYMKPTADAAQEALADGVKINEYDHQSTVEAGQLYYRNCALRTARNFDTGVQHTGEKRTRRMGELEAQLVNGEKLGGASQPEVVAVLDRLQDERSAASRRRMLKEIGGGLWDLAKFFGSIPIYALGIPACLTLIFFEEVLLQPVWIIRGSEPDSNLYQRLWNKLP